MSDDAPFASGDPAGPDSSDRRFPERPEAEPASPGAASEPPAPEPTAPGAGLEPPSSASAPPPAQPPEPAPAGDVGAATGGPTIASPPSDRSAELPPVGAGWPPDAAVPELEPGTGGDGEPPELIESLLTIWTEPRATIRRIVAVNPGFWVKRLAALVGLVFAVAFLSSAPQDELPAAGGFAFVVGLVIWPPMMILGVYFSAWLTRITGAWLLDGKAGSPALRTALAWSYVPLLALLPLGILAGVLSREGAGNAGVTAILVVFGLLYLTATIWCMVIQSKGVAEVQGYRSAWKGFLNLMLPGLLVFGVAFVLLMVAGIVLSLARI